MYEEYYGLSDNPFRLNPDDKARFKHSSYTYAKTYMQYALYKEDGVIAITGQAGTGKSALIGDLSYSISPTETQTAILASTQLEDIDLLRMIAFEFGLKGLPDSERKIFEKLGQHLVTVRLKGKRPLLIVDEAQNLPHSAFLQIQQLLLLESQGQYALQIFLIGQESLHEKLLDSRLSHLHQQTKAVIQLNPLAQDEVKPYIRHRLRMAGWQQRPSLDDGIFPSIYQASSGIPRLINLICGQLLLHGMSEGLEVLRENDIDRVLESLSADHLISYNYRMTGN